MYAKVRHFDSEANPRSGQSRHTGHFQSTAACEATRNSQKYLHGTGPDWPGLGCGIAGPRNLCETLYGLAPQKKTLDLLMKEGSGDVFWVFDGTLAITERIDDVDLVVSGRFYHPTHGHADLSTISAIRTYNSYQ